MMAVGFQVCMAVGITTIICASVAMYAATIGL